MGETRQLSWQVARVQAVRAETVRASRIVLDAPDWAGHLPGQHLDVRLRAPDGYTAQRSYSIASAPEHSHLELVVEGLPDGEVSPYLTGELRAGDELEVRGPVGGWFTWHSGQGGPLQLIAGGSGVVPFLAMLEHRQANDPTQVARLLYSVRDVPDVIARDRLDTWGADVTLVLTRHRPPGWAGPTGRVDRELLSRYVVPADQQPHVFVCGPTGFVEAVSAALVLLGHRPEDVKTERFGASGGTTP